MGTLYLVATPIGNLQDITARALDILCRVRLIAAEDTRHTRRLLGHYEIQTPMTSYHEHNKNEKIPYLIQTLTEGDIAVVSDAGTPGLNDPGYELVRAALDAGHAVSPIPGPSAPIAALVASGLRTDAFLYLGYLPSGANARRRLLGQVTDVPYTMIFLETPHRILAALEDIYDVLGDRQVAVARELTKIHEEIFRGAVSAAHDHFAHPGPRGEFTLVVAGKLVHEERWPEARVRAALKKALGEDRPPAEVARDLAAESGWKKKEVYRLMLELQNPTSGGYENEPG